MALQTMAVVQRVSKTYTKTGKGWSAEDAVIKKYFYVARGRCLGLPDPIPQVNEYRVELHDSLKN